MKIVLSEAEAQEILLDAVKEKYGDAFRKAGGISYSEKFSISWDGYIGSTDSAFTLVEKPKEDTP